MQPRLLFLATLNFPDHTKLMNDPMFHDLNWPPVPTKLPSDIPKFEGKASEDPRDHVTSFDLWCSSNYLNDDSIWLRLFQRKLTGVTTKWYIQLPHSTYHFFHNLAKVFLNHFQLLVQYDAGIDMLSQFRQNKATHISDHIQEWHRRKKMIKASIPPDFLLEWFLKSLLPYISKYVSTFGVTTEDEAIFKAQQLDLIYSQSGILYEIIPDAPRSNTNPLKPKSRPRVDGIVGSVHSPGMLSNQMENLSLQSFGFGSASADKMPSQKVFVHIV